MTMCETEAWVARTCGINLEKVNYPPMATNEVLVDIVACSICHSDVRAAQGTFMLKPPLILGHEAAGYVKAVGQAVTYVRPGDAVILAYASCARCRRCMTGKNAYCDELMELNFKGRRVNGEVAVTDADSEPLNGLFFGQSSMSRVALVSQESCVKVKCSKEELKLFASLGCGIETGAGAILNVAKPSPSSSIVVFGAGAVGMSAILAAKLTTPVCLVLVDNSQAKLDMLPKELVKGVHTLNSADKTPEDVANELKNLTTGGAGMDVALDCVGNDAVILAAHACLDKLGILLNVGSSATAKPQYLASKHLVMGITARGTHQGDSVTRVMIPHLIGLWRDGKFPFEKLLTEYKFEDLHKAFDETHAGRVIKPLLVM